MTMAKATTNGVVPMGVVACNDYIYYAVRAVADTHLTLPTTPYGYISCAALA